VVGYTVRDFRHRIGPGRELMGGGEREVPTSMIEGTP
jgi:hypothetical protein